MDPSFQVAICECPDINATTMAVDVSGRFAMVSGRKCMGLIDLDGGGQEGDGVSPIAPGDASDLNTGISTVPTISQNARLAPVCRKVARRSKYDPTASHFNRHLADLYAISTYQVVEIHSIEDLNPNKPKMILRGHSRAIADVEWSHFDPYLLGSSAADCLTNLWDIRDSRRPSTSLTSVSGGTQVRFSKTSSNLVAASHEIDVRVWDIRQPNLPLYYIAAHLQKINGMDWSTNHEQLITCSQDNTIKLWDLNVNKIKPTASLQTRTPAWRIRYTPVSPYAILTSTLPQLRSRTECMALKLWSLKSCRYEQRKLELILGLAGHNDVIVDFDWRNRSQQLASGSSGGACEIVSWSKDQTLRVWRVDNQLIEMNVDNSDFEADCCEHNVGDESLVDMNVSSSINDSSALLDRSNTPRSPISEASQEQKSSSHARGGVSSPSSPISPAKSKSPNGQETSERKIENDAHHDAGSDLDNDENEDPENLSTTNELKQEFNLINKNIPNLEFDELNYLRRVCVVTARAKNISCRLRIALPPAYPHNECPTFTIIDSNHYGTESLGKEAKEKLLQLLNDTAKAQLSRSRNCLEPCLRRFIAALQKITSHSSYRRRASGSTGAENNKDDPITLSAQRDHSVPFPPTSGARFCGNRLVCFGRPMIPTINTSTGESADWLVETPRSLAQLSAQLDNMRRQGSYNLNNISISYFYYGAMRRAELQSRASGKSSSSTGGGRITSTGGSSSSSGFGTGTGPGTPSRSHLSGGRGKSGALGLQSMMSKSYKCGPVIVYDVSNLLGGISKELAEDYVFDKDVIKMCRRNAEIAAKHNRRDLVQIWSLAELSSEGVLRSFIPPSNRDEAMSSFINHDSDFGDRPWTMHPFGSKLIQSLIDHYVYNCHDVQTAAMLVWTFSSPRLGRTSQQNQDSSSDDRNSTTNESEFNGGLRGRASDKQSSGSFYNILSGYPNHSFLSSKQNQVAQQSDAISDEWSFVNGPETHLYSNSWSNSTINGGDFGVHPMETSSNAIGVANELKSSTTTLRASSPYVKGGGFDECDSGTATVYNQRSSDVETSSRLAAGGSSATNRPEGSSSLIIDSEETRFPKLNILSLDSSLQNDLIMHVYAELLYRLNLLNQRAMVLKNIGSNSAYSEIFGDKRTVLHDKPEKQLPDLVIQCNNLACRTRCRSVQCEACKRYSFYCSICRLPVKGSCSICMKCLHGGHVSHFNSWFTSNDFCPTGCGCNCLTSGGD